MIIELNIGLDVNGGPNTPTTRMERALAAHRVLAESTHFRRLRSYVKPTRYTGPDGNPVEEYTLVVRTESYSSLEAVQAVIWLTSDRLQQECIAAVIDGNGMLIGPGAEHWGEFNIDFFHPYRPTEVPKAEVALQQRVHRAGATA